MKWTIVERLVRAKRNVHLHLGVTARKGEVKSMELRQPEGPFAGLFHLFIDSAREAEQLQK